MLIYRIICCFIFEIKQFCAYCSEEFTYLFTNKNNGLNKPLMYFTLVVLIGLFVGFSYLVVLADLDYDDIGYMNFIMLSTAHK